jgi:hypothetical protein
MTVSVGQGVLWICLSVLVRLSCKWCVCGSLEYSNQSSLKLVLGPIPSSAFNIASFSVYNIEKLGGKAIAISIEHETFS